MNGIIIVAGLLCLVAGAEGLVRGASRLAAAVGVSPLIIGLTVVAFGTSAPELAVSIKAAFVSQGGIALGNVVGSNIFNVLFILGLSALIVPLTIDKQLIRLDVPLMVAVSVVVAWIAHDGRLDRLEGGLLVAGLCVYLAVLMSKRRLPGVDSEDKVGEVPVGNFGDHWLFNLVLVVGGLALLVIGADWLVKGAANLARMLGVSEAVIGLTIVAVGTSLPEAVTSVVAALRNQRDIAVGNIVGSNIFNIMGVLGISSLVAPGGISVPDSLIHFDIPVMIAVACLCLPVFFTGERIGRWEGGLLFGYYLAYITFLVLVELQSPMLPGLRKLLFYALPLTLVAFVPGVIREIRRRPAGRRVEP